MAEMLTVLQDQLRKAVYVQYGPEYHHQLYALYGLLALSFFFVVGSVCVRMKHGGFWLLRRQVTSRGTWIIPNSIMAFLLLCGIFIPFLFTYARYAQLSATYGTNIHNSMVWRLPFWVSGCVMAWTTALTPLLARPNSALARYPLAFSISCLVVIIIGIATTVPLSITANSLFNDLFTMFGTLDADLTMTIAALESGSLSLLQMQTSALQIEAAVNAFNAGGMKLSDAVNRVSVIWCVLDGSLLIFFSIAAGIHFHWLGDSIKTLEHKRKAAATSINATRGSGSDSGSGGEYGKQMRSLIWAYRSLVFTSVMTLLCLFLYLALLIALAYQGAKPTPGSDLPEIVSLCTIYVYAIFGTLINFVLLVRSFAAPTISPASNIASPALPLKSIDAARGLHRDKELPPPGSVYTFQIGRDNDDDFTDILSIRQNGNGTVGTFTSYVESSVASYQQHQSDEETDSFGPTFAAKNQVHPSWDHRKTMYQPGQSETLTIDLGEDRAQDWRAGAWNEVRPSTDAGGLRELEKARIRGRDE